jgi:hypothetical protein
MGFKRDGRYHRFRSPLLTKLKRDSSNNNRDLSSHHLDFKNSSHKARKKSHGRTELTSQNTPGNSAGKFAVIDVMIIGVGICLSINQDEGGMAYRAEPVVH